MVRLIDMVMSDLKNSGAEPETLELWNSIAKWYEEGGHDVVEEGIMKKVKEIKSIARRQLKEAKEAMPEKKKKRKTRR